MANEYDRAKMTDVMANASASETQVCNRARIMLGHKACTCALYEEALELCKSL
jgi:hypothetical protein